MKLTLWLALRYLRRGASRYARFINWASLLGLALGVGVLTVVVSVMNGFDGQLKHRILGSMPHLVLPYTGAGQAAEARQQPGVDAAFRFFSASGLLTRSGEAAPVTVHGLDAESAAGVPTLAASMVWGSLDLALTPPSGLALGQPLAARLGLGIGDELLLALPAAAPAGGVRVRFSRRQLTGIFETGSELDYGLVLVPYGAVPASERRSLALDGLRVTLADPLALDGFLQAWCAHRDCTGVETWRHSHGELFQAVRIEKTLMFLILLLVVAVAGFNIIAGQTMLVDGKRSEIAVLRTLGASGPLLRRIFLLQGLIVASVGVLAGLLWGALAAANVGPVLARVEAWIGFSLVEGSLFDTVPSRLEAFDMLLIALASWGVCALAAWIPARRAADRNPVAGLHP